MLVAAAAARVAHRASRPSMRRRPSLSRAHGALRQLDWTLTDYRAMLQPTPGGIILDIRVIPRSNKSGVAGMRGDALLVRLHAPPVEGAANAELIRVIAATLGIAPRSVCRPKGYSKAEGTHWRKNFISVLGKPRATHIPHSAPLRSKRPGYGEKPRLFPLPAGSREEARPSVGLQTNPRRASPRGC